jgi:ferrochelatase
VIDGLGVLVMAYGTPRSLDDVEAYYTDIRRGVPPPDLLEELKERYRAIGGRSPLLEISCAQARGIQERLGVRAYLGCKHAAPFIADAVADMQRDQVERAVGLVLAPHYSAMSIGDYARRVRRAAAERGWSGQLDMVKSWHLEPGYIDLLAERVREALDRLPVAARAAATVIFSAHSLPARILSAGDPYPDQLVETATAVAERAGLHRWRVGWQSAGRTPEPWLGPDILTVMEEEVEGGARGVVVCACGFTSDHLEVLYDVDVEATRAAAALGTPLTRTSSPNADPRFLDVLAAVGGRALGL